jgi:hypothetical protein
MQGFFRRQNLQLKTGERSPATGHQYKARRFFLPGIYLSAFSGLIPVMGCGYKIAAIFCISFYEFSINPWPRP